MADHSDLIYDWNTKDTNEKSRPNRTIHFDDETLRDGLQSPSITDPTLDEKLRLIHLMEELGIDACDIGLPGASTQAFETCLAIADEIGKERLKIRPNCAVRTARADIEPLIEISQRVGYPVEAAMFIGSSPIRFYAEGWTLDKVLGMTEDAVSYATKNGIPVMFVTEDTTRTDPESMRRIFQAAIRSGAYRICMADTVGHITPPGVSALVRHVKTIVEETGEPTLIDWHGHSDRGLGIPNAMTAIYEGVDRVHATGLGIGERCGNTQMDQLLINLQLDGWIDRDLSALNDYCRIVSEATHTPIPANYPGLGRDAFRTSTGVHAAALIKAKEMGDDWLVDAIYSGVPAAMVGRRQEIEVGFMSGASNVAFCLREFGIEPTDERVQRVLRIAKAKREILGEDEIRRICDEA